MTLDDLWTTDKLILFLAFFIPGFIAIQIYSLFISTGERDFTKLLPDVVAYSAIHYAVTGWIIFVVPDAWRTASIYVVVLLLPIVWAPVILSLRNWDFYANRIFSKKVLTYMLQPEATPWDRVFSDQTERWVRIKTKAGEFVGGVLAIGSQTSTYPNPEQIYVKEEWVFENGAFVKPVPSTGGLLIRGDEIQYLELFEGEEGQP